MTKKFLLPLFCFCITVLPNANTSLANSHRSIDTVSVTPPDTETYIQQLVEARDQQIQENERIRAEKEAEKRRKQAEKQRKHLEKKKNELTQQCAKALLKIDKKRYNAILKVVTKMLDPINKNKKLVRGGYARIQISMNIVNTLLAIHKEEECGSERKYQRLDQLLNQANSELTILDQSPDLPLDVKGSHPDEVRFDEIQKYETHIAGHKKEISSVGGNISAGAVIIPQTGVGTSIGACVDGCGKRKASIVLHGTLGVGAGVDVSIGSYRYDLSMDRFYLRSECNDLDSVGFIISGTSIEKPNRPALSIHELGLNAGFHLFKGFLFGGVNLFPLPGQNMKYFRNQVGLVPNTMKLPSSLSEDIAHCASVEELKNIHINSSSSTSTHSQERSVTTSVEEVNSINLLPFSSTSTG